MNVLEPHDGLAVADDDAVMDHVRDGSTVALAVLYDRYNARAYRVARSVCRDHGRAEDAVQETFVAIWRSRETYDPRGRVAPWVLAIARYRATDIARHEGWRAAHLTGEGALPILDPRSDIAGHALERARAADLRSLIARLPDAQREVLALGFYGQMSHDEIAAHLDLPLGTVKGRMRLGLKRLRGDIERVAS